MKVPEEIDQSKYKLELDIFVEGVENQFKNDEGVNSEYRKLKKTKEGRM